MAAVACLAALAGSPSVGRAQTADRAIEFEDMGFTLPADPGVRWNALSAPAASVSDVTAVIYNPALLSRIHRPNAAISFAWHGRDSRYRYADTSEPVTIDAAALEFAGAAFPIPVLRGSFVPAFAIYRAFSSDLTIRYSGFNAPDDRDDTFFLQQSGSVYAYAIGTSVDLSSAISAGGSIALLSGHIDALRQFEYRPRGASPALRTFVLEDADIGVTGVVGRLGLEIYAHRHLHFGVLLTSPQPLATDRTAVNETTEQIDNDVGTFSRETTSSSTDYVLPYRIDVGLAAPWSRVTLAAQVGYSDWSQAAIDGHRVRTQDSDAVMRGVLDLRGGVEWSLPGQRLRLRAGVAHARGTLEFVEVDRVDNDRLERIASESGRTRVSLGAGYLIGTRLSIDAAYETARATRETPTVGDRVDTAAVRLQGSCWF